MAGIEDFVVEQIMQDFQNSPQAPAPPQQQPQAYGAPGWEDRSKFFDEARYAGAMRQTGLPEGAVDDPRSP